MRKLPDLRNTGQSCRHLRFLERASELTRNFRHLKMLQQRLTGGHSEPSPLLENERLLIAIDTPLRPFRCRQAV